MGDVEFTRLDPDADNYVTRAPRKRSTASSMLMAAMLGLAEALGWEKPKDDTVEVADAPIGGDGDLMLDYKHLEPLDP